MEAIELLKRDALLRRNHTAMQALFVAWYNFGRKNEALRNATPAMASKLTDHVWTIKELIERAAA